MMSIRRCLGLASLGVAFLLVASPESATAQNEPMRDRALVSTNRPERAMPRADAEKLAAAQREIAILEARIAIRKAEVAEILARARRFEAEERLAALLGGSDRERRTLADVERAAVPFPETRTVKEAPVGPAERRLARAVSDLVDPRNKPILDALGKKVVMAFPDKTPLEDVFKYLRTATKSDALPNGIPIFVDPVGIPEAELSMRKEVTIKADDLTLKDALTLVLRQANLSWTVKDGLLVISAPEKNGTK